MAGVKVASKIKFSVYLREKAVGILATLGRDGDRKTSASIAKTIRAHQGISSISPGTMASAKQYLKSLSAPESLEKTERVQTYLSSNEALYLEAYGKAHTNGNNSLAINKIVEEVAAVAHISPGLFFQYYEATK